MNRKLACLSGAVAGALVLGLAVAADDPMVLNTQDLKWEKCGDPPGMFASVRYFGATERRNPRNIMRF
jgi:hypothetical protein